MPSETESPAPSAEPTGTGGQEPAPEGVCAASQLTASAATAEGGGAAGTFGMTITLTNTSDIECTMNGFPGVSFVGGGNGTQIGAPAERDESQQAAPVTLAPGGSASAALQVGQFGTYDPDECDAEPVEGFRIYPPDQTEAVFAEYTGTAGCKNEDIKLLTVGPVTA
ncbi:DUF4232 domain-containing protein [Propionimicrobium sp. PCR01-08-3]|uniref:DUF4232 domain-containing protein n=1 Tax=Propionimicrobium sp. PCR01-08-3 TaxID=3052086 RepID=UPI00255CB1D3|nr:DUF4232 domain-containing protein [Propionimicrobium sp. PCR01-08-3]WIY84181.1 DUF4232 domain-containing protein [Propionimicrobium sp. PCR01-08-3]